MSKIDFCVNRSPLKTIVSRKVVSFSDISVYCQAKRSGMWIFASV